MREGKGQKGEVNNRGMFISNECDCEGIQLYVHL